MSRDSRDRLERLRLDALSGADAAAAALTALTHDRASATDDDEHDPEGVTLSSEWSRLHGIAEAAQRELRQAEAALARWDAGAYGICAACGRPIPSARLEARPTAEHCVDCAARLGR